MSKVHLNKHLARRNQDLLKNCRNNLSHDYACRVIWTSNEEYEDTIIVYNTIGKTKEEFLNKKVKIGYHEYMDPKVKWLNKGIFKIGVRDLNVPLDDEDIFVYDFTTNEFVKVDFRCFDEQGFYDDELTQQLHGDEKTLMSITI